jgi:hypothetical protein
LTGSLPRLKRLRRKEFPVFMDAGKFPSGQQSEAGAGSVLVSEKIAD